MIREALRMRVPLLAFSRELAVVIDETLHIPLSTVLACRSKKLLLPQSSQGLERLVNNIQPPWRLFGEFDAPFIAAAELLKHLAWPGASQKRLGTQQGFIVGGRPAAQMVLDTLPCRNFDAPPTRHSADFRSVTWFGEKYTFTANQAACIRLLWEAWENDTPELSGSVILETADIAQDRLSAVFRNHPAWGTMIRPGQTKGSYRLSPPAAHRKAPENHG